MFAAAAQQNFQMQGNLNIGGGGMQGNANIGGGGFN